MSKSGGCLVVVSVALVLCPHAGSALARGIYRRQTIVNTSTQPANDLHIQFRPRVDRATVRPADQAAGHDGDGHCGGAPWGNVVDFAPPDNFGTVNAGGIAYLDYSYPSGHPAGPTTVDANGSYWTKDGAALSGFALQGAAMRISMLDFFAESASVRNDQQTAQDYTVQLWTENSLTQWSLDGYFVPTGGMVGGAPSVFTLQPGEEAQLPFGPTTPYTYVLAMVESRPSGDPTAEPALTYLATTTGFASARLTYEMTTGRLMLDPAGNLLNGFIIESMDGAFTGAAVLPPGFLFNTNSATTLASQFGLLAGPHDFGTAAVNRGMLWNADLGDWDTSRLSFTFTVQDVPGVLYGDIELIGAMLPGDTDLDGDCDAWDIQRILAANSYENGPGWSWQQGDFNGDTMVNLLDIQMILDHGQYGQDVAGPLAAMIPEPATIGLLVAGACLGLFRRQRRPGTR